ncbi:Zn-dependent exopeptidase [Serendipita vermifera]|nr:Zn-dependent exopeptidase [Serendipita vermifera]
MQFEMPEVLRNKDFLPLSWPGIDLDLGERRLVQMQDSQDPIWITELEKIYAKASGKKFFDITDHPETTFKTVESKPFPKPNASEIVSDVIARLSTEGPERNLATFTSFRTRYYRSDTGRESQKWLLGRIYELTSQYVREDIDVAEFPHSWGQNSIVAKIPGSAPKGTVIISAHQDSINAWPFLPAPGADDDGSGTMTIFEAYRALLDAGYKPVNNVEFHWYSAEEGGLLGSQAVSADYAKRHIPVLAQLQFDMTAYVKKGTREHVGVVTDYVDHNVVEFVKQLIDAYLDIPYKETKCGYACSDHASWTKNGYPAAFTIESTTENWNHDIHSTNDRIDHSEFSFKHMVEFSKLAVAFAVELGGSKKYYSP